MTASPSDASPKKVGAFCVASSKKVSEIQVVVPIVVGALLHCNVSKACPDPSIEEYASDQVRPRNSFSLFIVSDGMVRKSFFLRSLDLVLLHLCYESLTRYAP